ncbi:MAG: MarR family transcriptional regulator [Dehalococcoidia bacterium]
MANKKYSHPPNEHSTDQHIIQFVGHLKEVMSKITSASLPDSNKGSNEPITFELKERVDPANFHRMGNILYAKRNPTMGEISEALGVPLSTATRMANWWVDNGYAQRLDDPDDRRVVRLGLTESGQQLLEMIEDSMVRNVRAVLSCLTPEEQTILITLSGKVAASLEEPER